MKSKEEIIKCLKSIQSQQFLDNFIIQEYRDPAWEESAFLLELRRNELENPVAGFTLLLERLEFLEQEWIWKKENVINKNRLNRLNNTIGSITNNGVFKEVDREDVLKKVNEIDVNFDLNTTINEESKNILIYDDWNLLLLIGSNPQNYYLLIWYTTA